MTIVDWLWMYKKIFSSFHPLVFFFFFCFHRVYCHQMDTTRDTVRWWKNCNYWILFFFSFFLSAVLLVVTMVILVTNNNRYHHHHHHHTTTTITIAIVIVAVTVTAVNAVTVIEEVSQIIAINIYFYRSLISTFPFPTVFFPIVFFCWLIDIMNQMFFFFFFMFFRVILYSTIFCTF